MAHHLRVFSGSSMHVCLRVSRPVALLWEGRASWECGSNNAPVPGLLRSSVNGAPNKQRVPGAPQCPWLLLPGILWIEDKRPLRWVCMVVFVSERRARSSALGPTLRLGTSTSVLLSPMSAHSCLPPLLTGLILTGTAVASGLTCGGPNNQRCDTGGGCVVARLCVELTIVQGVLTPLGRVWLGVPFAAPPLGDRRLLSCLLLRSTIHDPRSTTHDTRRTTHDTRHTIHDTRYTTHDTRYTIHDTRCTIRNTQAAINHTQ